VGAPPARRLLWALVLGFAATHGAYQVARAALHTKQGLDFTPEYIAARMLVDHADLRFYDHAVVKQRGRELGLHGPLGPDDPVVNYAYPPWLPLLYAPLSRLPWDAARLLWFALSLASTAAAVALLGAECAPRPEDRRTWAAGALAAACFYFPISYGLMAGQANDAILLLIVLSLVLLRRDRPFAAGLVLSVAGLWKIFTGFPVLFLLARREWRALAGVAAGCAALVLASLPFVGVQTWVDWATYIRGHNAVAAAAPRNHSIANAALLWFAPGDWTTPFLDSPALVRAVTIGGQLVAAALAAAVLWRPCRRDGPGTVAQVGATLVLAVLLTPKAWEHYGVFLLPAFVGLAGVLFARASAEGVADAASRPRPSHLALAAALAGASFCIWALLLQPREEYGALARPPLSLAMPAKTYAALLLCGVLAWAVRAGGDPRGGRGARASGPAVEAAAPGGAGA
jgi:alpha-1,2-mannosyltransferase